MWGLFTSELKVKLPAFAGNAIVSKSIITCVKARREDAQTEEVKLLK